MNKQAVLNYFSIMSVVLISNYGPNIVHNLAAYLWHENFRYRVKTILQPLF